MSFYKLDLSMLFNHKLFYDEPLNGSLNEIGLENSYILRENNSLLKRKIFNGVEFNCESLDFDNVICSRQSIQINDSATKIHFLAISTWIDTIEFLKVIYLDGSSEYVKVPFINWTERTGTNCELYYYDKEEKIKTVCEAVTSGQIRRLVCFHHSYVDIKSDKLIKEIILPDNMLIHIFAITLER